MDIKKMIAESIQAYSEHLASHEDLGPLTSYHWVDHSGTFPEPDLPEAAGPYILGPSTNEPVSKARLQALAESADEGWATEEDPIAALHKSERRALRGRRKLPLRVVAHFTGRELTAMRRRVARGMKHEDS